MLLNPASSSRKILAQNPSSTHDFLNSPPRSHIIVIEMGSIERHDTASFYFLRDLSKYQTEKPYEIWRESDPSIPKSNCEFEEHRGIVVNDMRSSEFNFDYESTGFKVLN